nr:ROK family protein [uncultured Sulfurimonas sp.]
MNLAIDAGGTHLRAKIYDKNSLLASLVAKSSEIGLCSWIEKILQEYKNIRNIGVSYAGQVENGSIISSPNISIDEHNIKDVIESRYKVSLKIENDLTCAVIAESQIYKSENICALYVGTGLGLGVISSGRVLRGEHNMAAEIGHIPYKEAPFSCGCGRKNCLELFASGLGIQKWMNFNDIGGEVSLQNLKNTKNNSLVEMFEEALLYGVGTAITLYNPKVLVLGGGVIKSNPYLKDIIIKNIDRYALVQALKDVSIYLSSIEDAPLMGALLLRSFDD